MEAFDALMPYAVQLSPWGLIGLGVLSIWKGWWTPKPVVDALQARIASEEKAKNDALEANRLLMASLYELLKKDDTAHAALQAIREQRTIA